MDFVLLIIGLALIILGANYLTEGASDIARRFKLSEFLVGVTIVGIGTSAPEIVVSIGSALKGSGDMAVGNVIGSNLFNTLVILGITALITPLQLTRNNVRKDIPFGVLASVVLAIVVSDIYLGDSDVNWISRSEGILLLSLCLIYLAYNIYAESDAEKKEVDPPKYKFWLSTLMTLGGLAALVYGGDMFLDKAIAISRRYGLSESVIGITLLAGGTSLPELASCVFAAVKGRPQLALGNILGSNIMNIFLVLGASATVTPLIPKEIHIFDLGMVFLSAMMLFGTAFFFKKNSVSRTEGGLFLAVYVVYMIFLFQRI